MQPININNLKHVIFVTIISVFSLVACNGESSEVSTAKSLVKQKLSDPESAQFSELVFNKETNYVCGQVNAKNKMGGYVGFEPVIVDLTALTVQFKPEPKKFNNPKAPPIPETSASLGSVVGVLQWQGQHAQYNAEILKIKEEKTRYEGEVLFFEASLKNKCKLK